MLPLINSLLFLKRFKNICISFLILTSGCYFWGDYATFSEKIDRTPYLKLAQEKSLAGEYAKAVEYYEAHITTRLKSQTLPAGENPYFYKALIGDLYLELDKPVEAKAAYLEAREHDISNEIVVDRIRQLARWYREHKQFDMARSILTEYRPLDPLMFDYDLDQLHREIIRMENENLNQQVTPETKRPRAQAVNS